MSRRIALPGADELFRSTGEPARPESSTAYVPDQPPAGQAVTSVVSAVDAPAQAPARGDEAEDFLQEASAAVRTVTRRRPRALSERRPSGRERHDEKITVYVSAEELMDLEQARLTLRGDYGLSVDRGRVVREALAVVLADLEAKGEASVLVRRLLGR